MSDIASDYERLFGSLLNDIERAESELMRLKSHQTSDSSVNVEAKTLQEEDAMLKEAPVEGLVDDDQSQYFIAVGLVENQVKELRIIQETVTAQISTRTNDLKFIKSEIEKQKQILDKFEKEKSEQTPDMINDEKKKEFVLNERFNKLSLKHLKSELRDFLEDTGSLDPSFDANHGSNYGHLLQVSSDWLILQTRRESTLSSENIG